MPRSQPLDYYPAGSRVWLTGDREGVVVLDGDGVPAVRLDGAELAAELVYPMGESIAAVSVAWTNEHADECPVTDGRRRLADDLQADPINPYLLGALVEWNHGDDEAEQCVCGVADLEVAPCGCSSAPCDEHHPDAPAKVTLELDRADATAIAEALDYLAGVDEGENTDYDNLVRLAELVQGKVTS